MSETNKILENLTTNQKEIIKKASVKDATILFNIKGMVQILHDQKPFEFIEMGYDDIAHLKREGILFPVRTMRQSHVIQGEEYQLNEKGKEIAKLLIGRM